MKVRYNYLLIVVLLICTSLLSGCKNIELSIEHSIKPPKNDNIAVKGTWNIIDYIKVKEEDSSHDAMISKYKDYYAIFDNEVGAIASDVCINPEYKIINASAQKYVQNKYRINIDSVGIKEDNISVVTVTSNNQIFYELLVTDENTAYVFCEKGFLLMKKKSSDVDADIKKKSLESGEIRIPTGEFTEDPLLRSGVLIGLRSENNTYRTMWIYSKNREIKSVMERRQLLVPRSKGFWEVGTIKDRYGESLYTMPFYDELNQVDAGIITHGADAIKRNMNIGTSNRKIHFVGNDYIGTEYESKYSVLTIDNVSSGKGISLSDIINGNPYNSLIRSSEAFVSTLDRDKSGRIKKSTSEDNFTLQRRNGHWIMKSRLYYDKPVGKKDYEDFDVNLMVPSKLINYDELLIPWSEIKSKMPWIIDAYISPNRDIALLVSEDSLNIYPVKNQTIINKPLMKIPLVKGDNIVMTEWAIGQYADKWANFVKGAFTESKPQ